MPTSSPYRNDLDALRERKDSLEQELARLRQETTHLEGLRVREEQLERELASISQRIGANGARRALPMLDQVRVASPCNASWDEMVGDDRVRFCASCEKSVYNLSAMPRGEAERLLGERQGLDLCVRFYQRADGTIMTEDCPVGVKKRRRRKVALAVAGAGAMALAATTMLTRATCRQGEVVMGAMPIADVPATGTPVAPPEGWKMGDRALPGPEGAGTVTPSPRPTPPKPRALMGRVPSAPDKTP